MDTLRQTRNLGITKAKNKISKNKEGFNKKLCKWWKVPNWPRPPLPPKCALRECLFRRQVFNIKRNEGSFLISYLSYLSKLPDTHMLPVRECRDILPIYKVPQMKQEIVMCKVQCIDINWFWRATAKCRICSFLILFTFEFLIYFLRVR